MLQVIDRIIKWNEYRGLLDNYNNRREFSFIVEELIEFCTPTNGVNPLFPKGTPKELSREISQWVYSTNEKFGLDSSSNELDALGDIIVFAVGAMAKKLRANGDSRSVHDILNIIMDANDSKGKKVDHLGKIVKDENFVHPEVK